LLNPHDLAARTNRIKLVTMAVALTSWDPLRLAEEITVLDHLSKGRFIPGSGVVTSVVGLTF
jgi:alkanesulfonate monooxygenase SsuD/methylene tetrahydromethanopterin reductase-like flavin-dependent oxidoreductase (luciferase family)